MKSIFASKMFWVNALAAAGMVVQGATGSSIGVEPGTQATLLAIINIALRSVTKEAVSWK